MTATATRRPRTTKKPAAKKPAAAKRPAAPPASKAPDRTAAGLPMKCIDPHPCNPRTEFDEGELTRLAESLEAHGLLQPIVVREAPKGRYQLIAGERRLRAAEKAGWQNVPAIVRDVTDSEALVLGLVENLERRDLNAIEKARGLERLCAPESDGGGGLTQVKAAAMFGHQQPWAGRLIALLTLPEVWQERIVAGELSERQAGALVPYAKKPAILVRIEEDMMTNPWSWRTRADFERNAKLLAEAKPKKRPAAGELEPMRAAPAKQSRAAAPAPGSTTRGQAQADVVKFPPEAEAPAEPAEAGAPHGGPVTLKFQDRGKQPSAVRAIIATIASLSSVAELDEVARAVDECRQRLALKA